MRVGSVVTSARSDLERNHAVEHHIARQPDLAHAAAPEPLDDLVTSKLEPEEIGTGRAIIGRSHEPLLAILCGFPSTVEVGERPADDETAQCPSRDYPRRRAATVHGARSGASYASRCTASEGRRQSDPKRPREPRRDVRIAVGVDVVGLVEEILDVEPAAAAGVVSVTNAAASARV